MRKRQRAAALQDASRNTRTRLKSARSWSAAALCRFIPLFSADFVNRRDTANVFGISQIDGDDGGNMIGRQRPMTNETNQRHDREQRFGERKSV